LLTSGTAKLAGLLCRRVSLPKKQKKILYHKLFRTTTSFYLLFGVLNLATYILSLFNY
jgi:hypothetical protein